MAGDASQMARTAGRATRSPGGGDDRRASCPGCAGGGLAPSPGWPRRHRLRLGLRSDESDTTVGTSIWLVVGLARLPLGTRLGGVARRPPAGRQRCAPGSRPGNRCGPRRGGTPRRPGAGDGTDRLRDAGDDRLRQRPLHPRDRLVAVLAPGDDLGQERVVVGRHAVAGVEMGVDADARAAGRDVGLDPCRRSARSRARRPRR